MTRRTQGARFRATCALIRPRLWRAWAEATLIILAFLALSWAVRPALVNPFARDWVGNSLSHIATFLATGVAGARILNLKVAWTRKKLMVAVALSMIGAAVVAVGFAFTETVPNYFGALLILVALPTVFVPIKVMLFDELDLGVLIRSWVRFWSSAWTVLFQLVLIPFAIGVSGCCVVSSLGVFPGSLPDHPVVPWITIPVGALFLALYVLYRVALVGTIEAELREQEQLDLVPGTRE